MSLRRVMNTPSIPFISALLFFLIFSPTAQAQTCQSQTFPSSTPTQFNLCSDLKPLSSSIHWTQNPSDNSVDIAFVCPKVTTQKPGWVAWGINFSSGKMVGTQALVAYINSSGIVQSHTSSVESYTTTLPKADLSFPVTKLSAQVSASGMVIFAKLHLGNSSTNNMRQLWQTGLVSGDVLQAHTLSGENVMSSATWNLSSGSTSTTGTGGVPRLGRKNVHGVLNAVSWGVLMPMGAMFARYMQVSRAADPAWFYLHVACQTSAYVVGVAGWATGIKLGNDSKGIRFDAHRNIGIILFCLGTLQVFALLLRPKKDHKLRVYWKIYHHAVGYAVIVLSIINVYKGFHILQPEKKWKRAYTGVIIALGAVAAVLEILTWAVVLRRKHAASRKSVHHGSAGGSQQP